MTRTSPEVLSSQKVEDKAELDSDLSKNLSPRHISMIAMGGTIGAGLFVGSSESLKIAGPSTLISYIVAAIVVFIVCQILGELATTWPGKGSYSHYATVAFGTTYGTTTGMMYWWFWQVAISMESVAVGNIIAAHGPGQPWMWTLTILIVMTLINLLPVKFYGESEFWLAIIKVVLIVAFIIVGILAIAGFIPDSPHGVSHLWSEGFAPGGLSGFITATVLAVTAYGGTESIALVSSESSDPVGNIKKSLRSIVWRIGLFNISTLVVASCLVPYYAFNNGGTFTTVLSTIGMPHANTIVDFIVLIAVCSCLNSSLYLSSRTLYSMGASRIMPTQLARLTKQQVPITAIGFAFVIALIGVVGSYLWRDTIFKILVASMAITMLLIYLLLILTQIKLRPQAQRMGRTSPVTTPLFPWLSIATFAVIVFIITWAIFIPEQRTAVITAVGVSTTFLIINFLRKKFLAEKIAG